MKTLIWKHFFNMLKRYNITAQITLKDMVDIDVLCPTDSYPKYSRTPL